MPASPPRTPVPQQEVTADLVAQMINYMRRITPLQGDGVLLRSGPGGTFISLKPAKRAAAAGGTSDLYPFLVWFVASPEEGATPIDGDYIVYIPPGSLSANGIQADAADFGLEAYTAGDYADLPNWYKLPYLSASGDFWLNFVFAPAEDPPFVCIIDTQALYDNAESQIMDGIARSVALAAVTVVPPSGEEGGEPGSVTVQQTTKGPLIYDFGVESLNGALGHLAVVGASDPVSIDGVDYYITVTREEGSGEIVVGLSPQEPEDDSRGYCNDVSWAESDNRLPANDISQDQGGSEDDLYGWRDTPDGNAISRWPCNPANNGGNS